MFSATGSPRLVFWISGAAISGLLLLAVWGSFSPYTVRVDGNQGKQLVHGIGCYFSNLSVNQTVLALAVDDLKLRTFRYPMFLQWEQAGGEFAARDNDNFQEFNWAHYRQMFMKNREATSLQERPDWFTGLQQLATHSDRILVSAWTFWEMGQEIPHLSNLSESMRNAQVAEDYAAVFLHARDRYGIDLGKIFFSINEPDVKGHNGKVLSAEEHHRLLQAVARKFAEEGLDAIRLAPPDVGSGRNVRTYLPPLLADPFLRPRIAAASYHLYGKGPQEAVSQSHRRQLEAWMTEYWLQQEGIDLNIFSALRSGTTWYLSFSCDRAIFPDGTRSFGYYNLKHFTRFIDFPSRYLASSANSAQLQAAAFQHPASGRLGVVVGNTGAARKVETELRNVGAVSRMYAYQTGGDKWATFLGVLPVTENKVTFDAPPGSLTTLVSTPSAGNDTPVAILRPSENPLVTVGLPVEFRADLSFDNDGDPLSYSWDFGDGSSSPEMNPVHMFSQLGSIRVTLTVADDKGAKSTAASTVTVEEQLPSAPPTLTVVSPRTDQVVDTEAIITWSDEDPDSDARITWFYDTDNKNFDGTRICSLFYEDFESGSLKHWLPLSIPWIIVADPGKPGNRVVRPQGVNSYLVLKKHFDEEVVLSVRQYGLGGPSVHFSPLLEAPASYRLRGNFLLSKRPGNLTLLHHQYDHSNGQGYWREIEAQDRNYGKKRGVALRGEIWDSQGRLLSRILYHDVGAFGYVPATRDRGASDVALYAYGEPGEYFDDICVDSIAARSEDDKTDRLVWDTSDVAAGAYYVYAIIADGENMFRRYSSGRIIVRHENGGRASIMNPDKKSSGSQGVSLSYSQRKREAW